MTTALEGQKLVEDGASAEVLDAWSEQSVESGRTMGWTSIDPDAIVAALLRETMGPLPFRPVVVGPEVLAWQDGLIGRIARGIYDERALHRMAILADALLDAGCDNEKILAHCREQESIHHRGCWVIDLLLNKS